MKNGITNKEFYVKTKALVESATGLLVSYIRNGEDIPVRGHERYRVRGPGWSVEHENKPDYSMFVYRHEEEIEALPEFRPWMEAGSADPVVSKHVGHLLGTRHGMINASAWDYLSGLILAQLTAGATKGFNREKFDAQYQDLERLFHNDKVGYRAFSPL